jgi:hypothetical protein
VDAILDALSHLADAPIANLLILGGLAFLAVGVIGKIGGKIDPGTTGRILSALVGVALLAYGVNTHPLVRNVSKKSGNPAQSEPARPVEKHPSSDKKDDKKEDKKDHAA